MKKNILILHFILVVFLSITECYGQIHLKQTDVINGGIGDNMHKAQPQNLRYKDSSLLKEGRYILDREEKDLKMSFYINALGQVDGEALTIGLPPSWEIKTVFRNDTLIKYDGLQSGIILRSAYYDKGIFYEKEFDNQGEFKNEYRYKNGEQIYSKVMNPSGWDVRDAFNGISELYYGESDIIRSRTTSKGLDKGIILMEEKFDEKGKLETKVIKYKNGNEKTINQDGSYEILIRANQNIYEYSSKGKLLSTRKVINVRAY